MRTIALALVSSLFAFAAQAQVALLVTKSGNDVKLDWTGGAANYKVIRSRAVDDNSAASMTVRAATIATGIAGLTYTDAGIVTDGWKIEFYVVSDSTAPSVAITYPAPNFVIPDSWVDATGTTTGIAGYVNTVGMAVVGGNWTATCPVTKDYLTGDLIVYAAAYDANKNWSLVYVTGTPSPSDPCDGKRSKVPRAKGQGKDAFDGGTGC